MPDDFADIEDAKERIFKGLTNRFASEGYIVFDEKFEKKPSQLGEGQSERWGGYQVEFKIAPREVFLEYETKLQVLRSKKATITGAEQKRTFKIDISKYEFCATKQEAELDDYTIYVYSLPMMAIEKLRAICQQMPEYKERRHDPKPRARDFFDIYSIIQAQQFDIVTPENIELLKNIFAAKEVPLELLWEIKNTKKFHKADWSAVKQSVPGEIKKFKFYFDFVVDQINKLKTIGIK